MNPQPLLLACTVLALPMAHTSLAQDRPNIVLILSDDQAWYGTSVPMHPDLPNSRSDFFLTPRLEELASQGMRFTAAYSPSPACSPTRASIQNGMNPAKNHITKAAPLATPANNFPLVPVERPFPPQIESSDTTIGEFLQEAGYRTAHYGKWHLGAGGPEANGYHESDGDTGNELAFNWSDPENPLDMYGMPEKALDFMRRASEAGQPAFVQLSALGLHGGEFASPETAARAEARGPGIMHDSVRGAAATEDLDTSVGLFLDGLDELGLSGNTYVIYMGDNGHHADDPARYTTRTPDSPYPLMGSKGNLYEGGIRVPFIIRGPGIDANSWSDVPIVGYDFLPTFAEWAEIGPADLPAGIEGGSFVSVLENGGAGEVKRPHEGLPFHFPHYQTGTPQSAIRVGDYKLVKYYEGHPPVLFDLSRDIGERNDLAAQLPQKAEELESMLDDYLASVDADIPLVNPEYDPSRPSGWDRDRPRMRADRGANGMGP